MKNKGGAILILIAGIIAGYGVRAYQDSLVFRRMQADYHDVVQTSYYWFRTFGASDDSSLGKLRTIWRKDLAEDLTKAVENRDYALNFPQVWGDAFFVMKDTDMDNWKYKEGMDSATQDDMVRYLCYRVRKEKYLLSMSSVGGSYEFEALATYPPSTIERNADRILVTMDVLHWKLGTDWALQRNANAFLVGYTGQKWAFDYSMKYFTEIAHSQDSPWFDFIGQLRWGSQHGRSPQGAESLLKWIASAKWPNELGTDQGRRIESVVDRDFPELKPSTSPSTTSVN